MYKCIYVTMHVDSYKPMDPIDNIYLRVSGL